MEPRSSLVGRDEDCAVVAELLLTTSPVTITGPGGVGKTRVAQRVAIQAEADFPDGVRIAELAHLRPNPSFPESLASALGFGSFDGLLAALSDATALLVLDNGEHLLDDLIAAIDDILQRCLDLRVLVTSREPLGIAGEAVHPLGPLEPESAVALLRERAAAAGARLPDDPDTTNSLLALASRVDALPLGLELAAIRLRSMSPADVVAGLGESDALLRRLRPGDTERHDSLRNAIAWGYELLQPRSARLLRQLAVFETPFTLQRAHAVAGTDDESVLAMADIVDRLVTQSMLTPRVEGNRTTYRVLETIRQFAFDQLVEHDELAAARERYRVELVRLAHDVIERGTDDWSPEMVEHVFELAPELIVGLRLCLEDDTDAERAFTLFLPSWGVIHHQHAGEFASIGKLLLDRWPDIEYPLWADVAAVTATALMRTAQADEALAWADAALAAPVGLISEPVARRVRALVHQHRGDWADALTEVRAGIEGGRSIGLDPFVAELQVFEATLLGQLGETDEALEKATAARIRNGELRSGAVYPWSVMQEAYLSMEIDPERAWELALTARTEIAELDTRWIMPRHLGMMAYRQGRAGEATTWFRESLDASRAAGGEIPHTWSTLRWIGIVAVSEGLTSDGANLLAATESSAFTPAADALEMQSLGPALELAGDGRMPLSDDQTVALGYRLLDRLDQSDEQSDADGSAATIAEQPQPGLVRNGEMWALRWRGEQADLTHSKGLADLARLVTDGGREVHAMELMGGGVDESALDRSLDDTAKRKYEDRLRELQAELDESEATNDLARSEQAQAEFDQIVDELASAFGLGGRDRTAGGSSEKARSAVTWRIRAAIKKIDKHLPGMAQHLRVSVKTGTWCSYQPEFPTAWVTNGQTPSR